MRRYRLECFVSGGKAGWNSWYAAPDDMSAIAQALEISEDKSCKVWDGQRLVAHFKSGILQPHTA